MANRTNYIFTLKYFRTTKLSYGSQLSECTIEIKSYSNSKKNTIKNCGYAPWCASEVAIFTKSMHLQYQIDHYQPSAKKDMNVETLHLVDLTDEERRLKRIS